MLRAILIHKVDPAFPHIRLHCQQKVGNQGKRGENGEGQFCPLEEPPEVGVVGGDFFVEIFDRFVDDHFPLGEEVLDVDEEGEGGDAVFDVEVEGLGDGDDANGVFGNGDEEVHDVGLHGKK